MENDIPRRRTAHVWEDRANVRTAALKGTTRNLPPLRHPSSETTDQPIHSAANATSPPPATSLPASRSLGINQCLSLLVVIVALGSYGLLSLGFDSQLTTWLRKVSNGMHNSSYPRVIDLNALIAFPESSLLTLADELEAIRTQVSHELPELHEWPEGSSPEELQDGLVKELKEVAGGVDRWNTWLINEVIPEVVDSRALKNCSGIIKAIHTVESKLTSTKTHVNAIIASMNSFLENLSLAYASVAAKSEEALDHEQTIINNIYSKLDQTAFEDIGIIKQKSPDWLRDIDECIKRFGGWRDSLQRFRDRINSAGKALRPLLPPAARNHATATTQQTLPSGVCNAIYKSLGNKFVGEGQFNVLWPTHAQRSQFIQYYKRLNSQCQTRSQRIVAVLLTSKTTDQQAEH